GLRVGLVGHSLGAVKCLYTLAHETLAVGCVAAVSPPRLSYSWFCSGPERDEFLADFSKAAQLVEQGQGNRNIEVKLPLPMVITAAGYVEKYGPDERYNFLTFMPSVRCSSLITFGALEVESNMAFRAAPDELARLAARRENLSVATVPGADHFYTSVRDALF